MGSSNRHDPSHGEGGCCVKWFKHWRSGKIIRAEDYGLKCFPIGGKKKK